MARVNAIERDSKQLLVCLYTCIYICVCVCESVNGIERDSKQLLVVCVCVCIRVYICLYGMCVMLGLQYRRPLQEINEIEHTKDTHTQASQEKTESVFTTVHTRHS